MVPVWEGTKPVDLDWDCDVAILATNQPGMDLAKLIASGVQILDCTNSIRGQVGVSSL
jgi:UDP-N-acetyl-D-glucosamine dehydrogenase